MSTIGSVGGGSGCGGGAKGIFLPGCFLVNDSGSHTEIRLQFLDPSLSSWIDGIDARCGQWIAPLSPAEIQEIQADRRSVTISAKTEDGTTIGYVVYTINPKSIVVNRIVIDEKWRRMGVGRLMVEKIKAKLDKQRRFMLVMSDERNLAALNFFKSMCPDAVTLVKCSPGSDMVRFEWFSGEFFK